jgi:hypothetical protein
MSDLEQLQPLLLPGGILDPNGKIGYFTNPTNGIDAIDLNDGSTIWTTNKVSYPLLATSNWLLAQKIIPDRSNAFQIAKLDLDRQSCSIWLSEPVVFPDWVSVRSPNTESNCIVNQVHASTEYLCFDWQAFNRYRGGAYAPLEILQLSHREDKGTVRIDLNSGAVEMLIPEDLTKDAPIEESFGSGCWMAGQNSYLVRNTIEGQQVLQLIMREGSIDRGVEKAIELGRGKTLSTDVTLDRCYILVCPDVYADLEQPWWIFSAETGQLLETVNYDPGTHPHLQSVSIFNSKIYYLVNRIVAPQTTQSVLRAKDLSSGKILWEYLIEPPKVEPPRMP